MANNAVLFTFLLDFHFTAERIHIEFLRLLVGQSGLGGSLVFAVDVVWKCR